MENRAIIGFTEALEEAAKLQTAKNYEDAVLVLEKMIEIVEDAGMFANTDNEEFFCFNNVLEQVLYDRLVNHGKKLNRVPDNYANMYHKYGALLFEAKRYDEAEVYLKKALRWNPVDTNILFEFSEIYKIRGDWKTFLDIMEQCLRYAYSSRALARCYRNLGFFYIEDEQYDLASALYLFSLHFQPKSETAYIELNYIRDKTGSAPHQPATPEEANALIQFIKDNGIQAWANPEIIDMTIAIGQHAMKENLPDEARFFFGVAYELTGNKEIGKILKQLDDNNDSGEEKYEHEEGKYDGEV